MASIIGLSLFYNRIWACVLVNHSELLYDQIYDETICLEMNGVWKIKGNYNYNTIWESMELNLLLATGAQWSDTIRRSITTEIDNFRFLFT